MDVKAALLAELFLFTVDPDAPSVTIRRVGKSLGCEFRATAQWIPVDGGYYNVFQSANSPGSETEGWRLQGRFHDADIDDDMIVGYPWLQNHKVAVLAGEDALGVGRQIPYLLVGWPKQREN